jgi:hypothetical protein
MAPRTKVFLRHGPPSGRVVRRTGLNPETALPYESRGRLGGGKSAESRIEGALGRLYAKGRLAKLGLEQHSPGLHARERGLRNLHADGGIGDQRVEVKGNYSPPLASRRENRSFMVRSPLIKGASLAPATSAAGACVVPSSSVGSLAR